MKIFSKFLSVILVTAMLLGLAACEAGPISQKPKEPPTYTLSFATQKLGENWNPHSWETSADDDVISLITSPLVSISIKDSNAGIYQWVYDMATEVKDVTKEHNDDLVKYGIIEAPPQPSEPAVTEGYVYEISLNKDAKWASGEAISADDYIYSMKQLLDPKLRNYRASRFTDGEAAIVGAKVYYNSDAITYTCVSAMGKDFAFNYDECIAKGTVFINVASADYDLFSSSLEALNKDYNAGFDEQVEQLKRAAGADGYTQITAENRPVVDKLIRGLMLKVFDIYDEPRLAQVTREALFIGSKPEGDVSFDTVGLYKVDDNTLRYVTATPVDINTFLLSLSGNWLVYKDYYEKGKTEKDGKPVVNYASSVENTMSYGPYAIESITPGSEMRLVRNENWYGWQTEEDGSVVSYTKFKVDGETVKQYQATAVVIKVLDDDAAKDAMDRGELSVWSADALLLSGYAGSDHLYKTPETYTLSLFFNTNLAMLKNLDAKEVNKNGVVLTNKNFRKALSLAINREEWAELSPGFEASYALLNESYYYDIHNNHSSAYRDSEQAKSALDELYGESGATGTKLDQAKELMTKAYNELVDAKLYKEDETISLVIAYKKEALDDVDKAQIELLNKYINAAAEGSGFGEIKFEGVGGIDQRHQAVITGEYAIGCNSWGGAAYYPFRVMQVYCDPDRYDINEAADWNPKTENLEMTIGEGHYVMTWQAWSRSMETGGVFADADFDTKLQITANLEKLFLAKYYRIPLASYQALELLSAQQRYYTDKYNTLYGFGGLRLIQFDHSDAEWSKIAAEMRKNIVTEEKVLVRKEGLGKRRSNKDWYWNQGVFGRLFHIP